MIRRILVTFAALVILVIAAAVVFLGAARSMGDDDGPKPTATNTPTATATKTNRPCAPPYAVVTVKNKQGETVEGAEVSVIGPYPIVPGVTPEYNGVTQENGTTRFKVGDKGDYDISVTAAGYEKAVLVGRDDQTVGRAPKLDCGDTKVEVSLDRPGEVPPPSTPTAMPTSSRSATATPDSGSPSATPTTVPPLGSFAFVYTLGVDDKEGVCRSLFAHRIISSCDEINEPVPVKKSGTGWSTYVRSGQTVHVVDGVSYSDEPFWEVTFRVPRADGLEVVYVQRKCGNVSAPPGKTMPPSKPFVPTQPQPTPTPGKEVPTATPKASTSTPPPATKTPVPPTRTTVPPTATPKAPTQTPAPTQTSCCTLVPDHTRPAVINTPVNTIAVPSATPMPQQTVKPPGPTNTPIGDPGCGLFCE